MRDKVQVGSKIYEFIPEIGLPKDFDLNEKLSNLEVALIPCQVGEVIPLSSAQDEISGYRIRYHPTRKKDNKGDSISRHHYVNTIQVKSIFIPNEFYREQKLRNGFLVESDKEGLGLLVDLN